MTHLLARPARIAAVVALLVAGPAAAQEDEEFARRGAYLGFNGVAALQNFDDTSGLDVDDSSLGAGGRFGVRLHPYVAVETQFEWLSGYDFDVDSGQGGGPGGQIDRAFFWSHNLKGFALTGRLQPYALVGLGWQHVKFSPDRGSSVSSSRESALSFRYGAGLDFYIIDSLGLTAEVAYVQGITGDADDFDYASFLWGAFIRF